VRAALVVLVLLASCAHRQPGASEPRVRDLEVGAARFRVTWWPGDDRAAEMVARALVVAAPRVERWGALRQRVTVTIHPTHEALEHAVQRSGYEWLRAWARYDTIDLESPRTWSALGTLGVSVRRLEELLTHELTHCAMYQLAGNDLTWMFKEIPRWFSEGIATTTAGQGYRFPDAEELCAFYDKRLPGSGFGETGRRGGPPRPMAFYGDPIVDSDPIYQEQQDVVYGAAHEAGAFLIRRYGEERVRQVLDLMGKGLRFPAAFKQAIGITDAEFANDFRRYVVWQGWRR
jgi:hypothetical protein